MKNAQLMAMVFGFCLFTGGPSRLEACSSFRRGDANLDSAVDISDPVRVLNVLFLGNPKPDCDDLLDSNDDGSVDISDGIFLLSFLFGGGPSPPAPFPDCGEDRTADALGCANYLACDATCLSPAAVLASLTTVAATGACVPTGMPPLDAGPAEVTILPSDEAQPCGTPPAPGWPVQLTVAEGAIDIPAATARVHLQGRIDDLPVVVEAFFISTDCLVDVTFEGDAIFTLAIITSAEKVYFAGLTSVNFDNVDVDVSASGGLACDIGQLIVGFVESSILSQIEASIADELVDLSESIGCREICPE